MIERFVVVVALGIVVMVIAMVVRVIAARRTAAVEGERLPAELERRLGGAGIVYFFGAHCASCRQQGEILDRLEREARVAVVRVDAVAEQELSAPLGVMTVPSTVVVDSGRRIRAVNLGFRAQAALEAQVRALDGPLSASA